MKTYPVVDKDDNRQYTIKGKDNLHAIKNIYHRSSHIFIEVFGGKLLLQKKAASTENGGLWSSAVSGHVELDDTYVEKGSYRKAAVREAKEELGLSIDPKELDRILKLSPVDNKDTAGEFVTLFYYLMDPNRESIVINRDELDGIVIMPLKEVENEIKINRSKYSPVFALLFDLFMSLKGGF